jgi:hypothetical protein
MKQANKTTFRAIKCKNGKYAVLNSDSLYVSPAGYEWKSPSHIVEFCLLDSLEEAEEAAQELQGKLTLAEGIEEDTTFGGVGATFTVINTTNSPPKPGEWRFVKEKESKYLSFLRFYRDTIRKSVKCFKK